MSGSIPLFLYRDYSRPASYNNKASIEEIQLIIENDLISIFAKDKYRIISDTNYLELLEDIDQQIYNSFSFFDLINFESSTGVFNDNYFSSNAIEKEYKQHTLNKNPYVRPRFTAIKLYSVNDYNFYNFMLFYHIILRYKISPRTDIRRNHQHIYIDDETDTNMTKFINDRIIKAGSFYSGMYDIVNISANFISMIFELLMYKPTDKQETVYETIKRSTPFKKLFICYLIYIRQDILVHNNPNIYDSQIPNDKDTIESIFITFIKTLLFNNTTLNINKDFIDNILRSSFQTLTQQENNDLIILYVYIAESLFDFILINKLALGVDNKDVVYKKYIEMFSRTLMGRIYDSMISIKKYQLMHHAINITDLIQSDLERETTITHLQYIQNLVFFNNMIKEIHNFHKLLQIPEHSMGYIDPTNVKNKYLKYKKKYLEIINS
jgi:hypothetical protein